MTKLQNPFVTGGYVAPEYFCDREKETKQLLKSIQNGNNVTLIAITKHDRAMAPTSADFVKKHSLTSASSVQAALKGLIEKEFVTRDETGYAVYDKFLEMWLKEKY